MGRSFWNSVLCALVRFEGFGPSASVRLYRFVGYGAEAASSTLTVPIQETIQDTTWLCLKLFVPKFSLGCKGLEGMARNPGATVQTHMSGTRWWLSPVQKIRLPTKNTLYSFSLLWVVLGFGFRETASAEV